MYLTRLLNLSMNKFLDILNTLYKKDKVCYNVTLGECIALTKTLVKDINNIKALSKCIDYLFYIDPNHYFYLLYFNIPRKNFIPKLIQIEKQTVKEDKLLNKIQYVLGWSNRELNFNKRILEFTIDSKQYKKEMAI